MLSEHYDFPLQRLRMNRVERTIWIATLVCVLGLLARPAVAEEPPAIEPAAASITVAEVEAALASMSADAQIKKEVKPLLRLKYEQALEALKEGADFATRAAEFRDSRDTAPEQAAVLQTQLTALQSEAPDTGITSLTSVDDFQQEIDSRAANRDMLNDHLSKTELELARVEKRPFEISSRLPAAQRELSGIITELAAPRLTEGTTSPGRIADRILLQAKWSRLASEMEMLEQERASQSVREELLEAQLSLYRSQVEIAASALSVLGAGLRERVERDAEFGVSLAERILDAIPENDEAARGLGAEVYALARELRGLVEIPGRVQEVRVELTSRNERLNSRFQGVREELEVTGGGRGMAQVLLDMQRRYPAQVEFATVLTQRLPTLDEIRLAALQVRSKLRNQPDVESRFADHPSDVVTKLVADRRDLLERLRGEYGKLTRDLAALESDRLSFLDKAKEVQKFASQQLVGFGMRSAPPISVENLSALPEGIGWFFRGDHWVELSRELRDQATRMPVYTGVFVLFLVVLLLARGRIVMALERTGDKVRKVSQDRFAYTLEALLWTLLLAAPLPLLLWFTERALEQSPESSAWLGGIDQGLQVAVWIAAVTELLAQICRPDGLGDRHFRWPETSLLRLRRSVRWIAVVYIPALLVTFSGWYLDDSSYFESVGRVSFIVAHVWAGIVLWKMLNFSDGVFASFIRESPTSLIASWRYLWFPSVVAYPLVLVVLAWMGYLITATTLSLGFFQTAAYIVAGTVLYRLTRRWFRIKERRLALEEELEQQRMQREAANSADKTESGDIVQVDPEAEEHRDLFTISQQTLYLLRLIFGLGVASVIVLGWSEIFPITETLDTVAIPLAGGLTLLGLFKGLLILIVTYIATKNLPGLLELAVLRATSIQAGTRNAISTLVQYTVVAIGLVLFFNALEVDWTKLGWIAAALSVGIGFGLQEVVANFVCGIILLFERPIRVGDYVTVGATTGTVSKIQIRATTITTRDRQDYVVPNKSLITGPLLNWTLNTGLNRLVVRVGVASESDPEEARRILLEVARDNQNVLDEPPPKAIFAEFGASSLDLVLYAFIASVDQRSSTTTDLLTEINKRFAETSIGIPNPQMDLHIQGSLDGVRA